MKKRLADVVVDTLIKLNINTCFSVVGGGSMHLNNAFALKKNQINTIYNHHEQACTMAAEGYARYSGGIAAVCVTSGPGGTNAINGVQSAWVDSIPMIVFSGHPRYETTVTASGLNLRVRGVQENDIISMVSSITKYAKTVLDPKSIVYEIEKAISIAMDGRRGPVWLSVPLDIQGALVEEDELYEYIEKDNSEYYVEHVKDNYLDKLQYFINQSKRPCILTGSGIRTGAAESLFRQFMSGINVPVVGGAQQADINYNGENNYYGLSGSIGPRTGNYILYNADLIIVLANSLSFNQTGNAVSDFVPNAKIVMINAEEDEAKKDGLHVDLNIVCDIKEFFEKAIDYNLTINASQEWINQCNNIFKANIKYEMLVRHGELNDSERVPALLFWKEFMKKVQKNAVINLGNSCSVHGILQEGADYADQRIMVNYNCGSMGADIPNAIGSTVTSIDLPHYCVTGEGSVMMNIQEFQTIYHYKLPIKTVIFNNNGYGAIRNTCESFFNGFYNGCTPESGISFPDISDVAKAFKIPYKVCRNVGELHDSLDWIVNYEGYCILEIYEILDEIRGPKLVSRMDENGVFYTPPVYDLSPVVDEKTIRNYIDNLE
ncbi:acetolactate synthase-1/2/3 large subunit [Lachnospiraceae bacterium]|nr:acetolactate synthase-1/2/3 large subunit [Lachnospiraceae bacterium]